MGIRDKGKPMKVKKSFGQQLTEILKREVERETPWILKVQSYRNPFLDVYFKIATMMGEELFLISLLPFTSWILRPLLAVHQCLLLALAVGGGNILKNLFQIPRPSSPPVWTHVPPEKDHGLPSTHTMTCISIPWYFLVYYWDSITFPAWWAVLALIWWSGIIMFSRIYNGHHTPMDIAGGTVLSILILYVFTNHIREPFDALLIDESISAPLGVFTVSSCILWLHPTIKTPNPAHAESGLVFGTFTGAAIGMWLTMREPPIGAVATHCATPAWAFALKSYPFVFGLARFLVGAVLVAVVRSVAKALLVATIPPIFAPVGVTGIKDNAKGLPPSWKYTEVEVIIKFLTYIAISFTVLYPAFIAYCMVGLNLPRDLVINV